MPREVLREASWTGHLRDSRELDSSIQQVFTEHWGLGEDLANTPHVLHLAGQLP